MHAGHIIFIQSTGSQTLVIFVHCQTFVSCHIGCPQTFCLMLSEKSQRTSKKFRKIRPYSSISLLCRFDPVNFVSRLVPSLMREGSYSTIRLGAYEPLKRLFGATDPAHTPLWKKICAGAISGLKDCNHKLHMPRNAHHRNFKKLYTYKKV